MMHPVNISKMTRTKSCGNVANLTKTYFPVFNNDRDENGLKVGDNNIIRKFYESELMVNQRKKIIPEKHPNVIKEVPEGEESKQTVKIGNHIRSSYKMITSPTSEIQNSYPSKDVSSEEYEEEEKDDIDIMWIEDSSIKISSNDITNKKQKGTDVTKKRMKKRMRKRSYSKEDLPSGFNERLDTGEISPEFVVSDEEEYQIPDDISKDTIEERKDTFSPVKGRGTT